MNRAFLVTIIILVAFISSFSVGESLENRDNVLERLRSENPKERENATVMIVAARDEAIKQAEKIITESADIESQKGMVKTSILLLGKLQSQHSVSLLVNRLTFALFSMSVKRVQTFEDAYPCVQALIDIGLPSIDPLVEKVKNDDDEKVVRCAGKVIKTVLGKDAAIEYLTQKMSKEGEEVKKTRLSRLVEQVSAE
ncbi:MAG TPA: hypothetical protein PK395_13225 [bacterium]|nr:hypothetical protein [bacterium]HQQ00828.1 hypothetical protein [bacterium]